MVDISANAASGINWLTTINKISTFRGDILLKIRMPLPVIILQKSTIQYCNSNRRQTGVTNLPSSWRVNEVVVPIQGIIWLINRRSLGAKEIIRIDRRVFRPLPELSDPFKCELLLGGAATCS